jgi:anti-sigma regulatory factor (Ser/Thr protein kinase)
MSDRPPSPPAPRRTLATTEESQARSPSARPASGEAVRTYLPASNRAPRQARVTVRDILRAWGLSRLSADAELITSELVANAAEHAAGTPIELTIRQHAEPGGHRGILCQVTDASPDLPLPQSPELDSERGRGLQIVTALATTSGITPTPPGKTAWFTLTAQPDPTPARRLCREAEAGL